MSLAAESEEAEAGERREGGGVGFSALRKRRRKPMVRGPEGTDLREEAEAEEWRRSARLHQLPETLAADKRDLQEEGCSRLSPKTSKRSASKGTEGGKGGELPPLLVRSKANVGRRKGGRGSGGGPATEGTGENQSHGKAQRSGTEFVDVALLADSLTCSVCGEGKPSEMASLPCSHRLCRPCMAKALQATLSGSMCSICNQLKRCECGRGAASFWVPGHGRPKKLWCPDCPARPPESVDKPNRKRTRTILVDAGNRSGDVGAMVGG